MEQGNEADKDEGGKREVSKPVAATPPEDEKEKEPAASTPEKPCTDELPGEKHSPEKQHAQKSSPEKPASEKPAAEKLTPEKPPVEKPSPDKVSPDKVSPEQLSPEKLSREKLSPEKVSPEKPRAEKVGPEKPSPEKPSAERASTEKPGMEKPSMEKPVSEKASPIKLSTEKLLSDKPAVQENTPVEKPSAEKTSVAERLSPEKLSVGSQPVVPPNFLSADKASPEKFSPEKASSEKPCNTLSNSGGGAVASGPLEAAKPTVASPPLAASLAVPQVAVPTPAVPVPAVPPRMAGGPPPALGGQSVPRENGDVVGPQRGVFSVSWLDLAEASVERALREASEVDVLALQGVEATHWGSLESQLPDGHELLRGTGLALVVRCAAFRVLEHSSHALQSLVAKVRTLFLPCPRLCGVVRKCRTFCRLWIQDLETLEEADREAVQSHLRQTPDGHLLTVRLQPLVLGQPEPQPRQLVVANAALSPAASSTNALQVCCVARELCREVCGAVPAGRLLVGRLQLAAGSPAYQLLRDGYLDDDMIEELQRHRDVALPGRESAALVNLLWKAFQHPSSSLRSCYAAKVEEGVPAQCPANSPAWFSSENLRLLQPLTEGTHLARLAFCSP
ncbi:hypothetical protein V5799_025254 [Amblyomma americanum]|uniref:Uncharacterized protein n=1 Tax=Amblyomma americanum TaxID=6943 RepID=A0AAQ4EA57_AMBAM